MRFDEVGFRYREDGPMVLEGVSFEIPARGLIALVGPSGAGKTTLFALLERFYDPTEGSIAFAGRDLRAWPRAELRAAIAYVEQEAPVLAGTLRANLLYAAPEASEEELRGGDRHHAARGLRGRAARRARHRDRRARDDAVGRRAPARSRSPARCCARRGCCCSTRRPRSSTRSTRRRCGPPWPRAAAERAVVAIAHRLSTVVAADRILLIEGGRVRAQGTHVELVEGDELYRELRRHAAHRVSGRTQRGRGFRS